MSIGETEVGDVKQLLGNWSEGLREDEDCGRYLPNLAILCGRLLTAFTPAQRAHNRWDRTEGGELSSNRELSRCLTIIFMTDTALGCEWLIGCLLPAIHRRKYTACTTQRYIASPVSNVHASRFVLRTSKFHHRPDKHTCAIPIHILDPPLSLYFIPICGCPAACIYGVVHFHLRFPAMRRLLAAAG